MARKYGGMEASDVRRLKELEEKPATQTNVCRFEPKIADAKDIIKKALAPVAERKVWARDTGAV